MYTVEDIYSHFQEHAVQVAVSIQGSYSVYNIQQVRPQQLIY